MLRSYTRGKTILVEMPSGERHLIVQVEIDCPSCGRGILTIQGHHLPVLKQIIEGVMTDHPDLTAVEGIEIVHREDFRGTAPGDPTQN